jgi:large subunit ribosomal protein L29
MTKATDFRGRTEDELTDAVANLKKEQFNLRFQKASGQLEAAGRIQVVRRDIARIKTIQGERGRAAARTKA